MVQAAGKLLRAVEVGNDERHHQRELNGVSALKAMFGTERTEFEMELVLLGEEIERETTRATWYDSRERQPNRTEYRLYMSSRLLAKAEPGWLFAIVRGERAVGIVASPSSAPWLVESLGLEGLSETFRLAPGQVAMPAKLRLALSEAGVDVSSSEDRRILEALLERYGGEFPGTAEFSAFARETCPESPESPDARLVAWMDHEYRLFGVLESYDIRRRMPPNFTPDEMVAMAQSVQNRRFSRAGQAFEHHVGELLSESGVAYERGAVTELGKRPDFLFPGAAEYRSADFPAELLAMLGAKTSLKDRWRQVASEANRIPLKHLVTLQPSLAETKLREASDLGVAFVSPMGMPGAMSLSAFIELVKERQERAQYLR